MPLTSAGYKAPFWLLGGHAQTIAPALLRSLPHGLDYQREQLELPDGDFLDLDWLQATDHLEDKVVLKPTAAALPPLAVLSHGLEGSTESAYLQGMARYLARLGLDVLSWNCRSCSGQMNRLARFYHLGDTGDLAQVIAHGVARGYGRIVLVGFSAGAAITLKYLGEDVSGPRGDGHSLPRGPVPPQMRAAVAVSAPLDLSACTVRLETGLSQLYNRRFCRTLVAKIAAKARLLPGLLPAAALQAIAGARTLRQFDELATAPLHGFASAEDYYRQSSALQYLGGIQVPTLLLTAKNDPFLSAESFADVLGHYPAIQAMLPREGGHCGFATGHPSHGAYWSEQVVGEWVLGEVG